MDRIERDKNELENDTDQLYNFRRISAYQGPLISFDKEYKDSTYNVLVEWELVLNEPILSWYTSIKT